jgi:hypothetical protein
MSKKKKENGRTVIMEQEPDSEQMKKSLYLLGLGVPQDRKEDNTRDMNRNKTIRYQRGIKSNPNCKH